MHWLCHAIRKQNTRPQRKTERESFFNLVSYEEPWKMRGEKQWHPIMEQLQSSVYACTHAEVKKMKQVYMSAKI